MKTNLEKWNEAKLKVDKIAQAWIKHHVTCADHVYVVYSDASVYKVKITGISFDDRMSYYPKNKPSKEDVKKIIEFLNTFSIKESGLLINYQFRYKVGDKWIRESGEEKIVSIFSIVTGIVPNRLAGNIFFVKKEDAILLAKKVNRISKGIDRLTGLSHDVASKNNLEVYFGIGCMMKKPHGDTYDKFLHPVSEKNLK